MKRIPKDRLDNLLIQRGLADDVKHAQALILSGAVLVGERIVDKAGTAFPVDMDIRVKGDHGPYVSRGGLKLQGALDAFAVFVENLVVLDVGASTGGFTDCLLQRGARKVYAVDVGYGQLAWKLQTDPRVVNIERTNIRSYNGADIGDAIDMAVIDASFISLRKVLPSVVGLIREGGVLICLVKPQFEVARGEVGEKGVVRDPLLHKRTLEELADFCRGIRLDVLGRCDSPITGPAGNREFFLYLKKPA
jgi:23S rRNA (cytidine1920-2'-O)/16S rRNA (cytidine1409-2'-O)-methyltransferase